MLEGLYILLYSSPPLISIQNVMFRIKRKSKSTPKFTQPTHSKQQKQNHYQCLKEISSIDEHWKNILMNELDMSSTILAFQNVEVSMRIDARRKLILRETFVLKKQIIRLIIHQKFEEVLQKLELLGQKSSSDLGLATIFSYFYRIREKIISEGYEYTLDTIEMIKKMLQEGGQIIQKQKVGIIYGRIVYILALHLIRLNGVLINKQDIGIVAQALNLKKKELSMVANQINQGTLESLLYLTFEFYRILYILKQQQDLLTQYYYQIKAYISIFKAKCKKFEKFEENFRILERIEKMIPISLNLKIYEDHQRRRILSLQNTQTELLKNHFQLNTANIFSSQIHTEINQRKSKQISSQNSQSNSQSASSKKLMATPKMQNKSSSELGRELIEQNSQRDPNRFCFQFIKPDEGNIIKGCFRAVISKNKEELCIDVQLIGAEQIIGMFEIKERLDLEKEINIGICAKKLWKIIKQTFYTDKTEFLPSLFSYEHPSQQDLPKNIDLTYELPILVRVHQILLHYLRKKSKTNKINGQIIEFPKLSRQIQKEIKKDLTGESKIFAKRHGFISYSSKPNQLTLNRQAQKFSSTIFQNDNLIRLIFFLKEDEQILLMKLHFENCKFKEAFIFTKGVDSNRRRFNSSYGNMKFDFPNFNLKRKGICKIMGYVHEFKIQNAYYFGPPNPTSSSNKNKHTNNSIEEEFQVMKAAVLQSKKDAIKKYKSSKFHTPKKIYSPIRKVFKVGSRFLLFQEQNYESYKLYFDNKRQFILCDWNKDCQIEYKKFRLYKTIVFHSRFASNEYLKISYTKSRREENSTGLFKTTQKVTLFCLKSKIFKSNSKFYYLNIFHDAQGERMVLNAFDFYCAINYMGVVEDKYNLANQWNFDDSQCVLNNSIKMNKFSCGREKICDAQEYLNFINKEKSFSKSSLVDLNELNKQ